MELGVKKKVEKFEDLEVWQESMRLTLKIYDTLRDCRDYGLRDQIQRAAVSVPSNIAEGYERNSNKEFIQYLHIAKGSCSELRTHIYLGIQIGLISQTLGNILLESTRKISAMLYNYIKVRKERF
ncbi:MAG: four helix bundle protein [Nitrospirota bacterium]|nr:four helix bundle protein [Nitrospirota bacterium]